MAAKNEYKITAKNAAEFKELEDFVKSLPENLQATISRVEKGLVDIINVECKNCEGNNMLAVLPPDFWEIMIYDGRLKIKAKNAIYSYPQYEGNYNIIQSK